MLKPHQQMKMITAWIELTNSDAAILYAGHQETTDGLLVRFYSLEKRSYGQIHVGWNMIRQNASACGYKDIVSALS